MKKAGERGKRRKSTIPARRGPGISESELAFRLEEKDTELKAAGETLEASERRYRELVDLAPIGIFRSTLEGRFVSVNPALASLLGYDSPDEMLQLDLRADVYFDGAERDRRLSERESAGMSGFEVRWKRRDGSPIWVRLDSRVIRKGSGDIELFEGFVHDIEKRKGAEESIQKLLLAVEQAQDAIFMTDSNGAITYVNPAFERSYGYSRQETLGKTPRILKSGQHDQAYYERFWEKLLEGESIREEFVNKRRDGQLVTVEASVSPVLDAQGRRVGFIAVQADITERKRAEESLWESEQRYRSLFESMLHGYAYCEVLFENGEPRDFVYLDVNKAFEKLTGLKDVVGRKATEVIPGIRDSSPDLFQKYGKVALTGIPENFEICLETLGIWFSISAYSPEKGRFVALFDNITDRKRAEDSLRRGEKRWRALMENAGDAILIMSPDGTVVEVNRAAERLFGRAQEGLIGRQFLEFLPAEERAAIRQHFGQMLAGGPARDENRHALRPDGQKVPIEVSASPVEIGGDQFVITIIRDVSERQQLEEQLRLSQKMEAVGQLAGGVAHDFNNLLTAILGYAEMLASRPALESGAREEIGEIQSAAGRAAGLTRQLLAFSRKQVLEPVVLRANDLVADLEKLLRRVIGEDVDLVTRLDPSVGNVRADRGQLEQVIMNLVVNARDAMPRGGKLTIETANADLDEGYAQRHASVRPGRYVMVAVSDTGTGMDEATAERIFEPFFTTKEKGKGTGLGLSTVYGIVKQSGGNIWVYSEPGKGTTFKVYLPRVEDVAAEGVARPADPLPARGNETILLVEDEGSVRTLARRILEKHGYRVLEAPNGIEAEKLAAESPEKIDVLLTDLVMPDMAGTELASRLQGRHPTIRVLFMSGYTDDAVVRNGMLGRGRAFLQKPFTPAMLLRRVRDVLA
ncbi:MAG: PAS domain S-box protein [Thermoanaerobaculia bacterium]|nr:PAS domain S-box protein [Thermoanaerobaculia bacterium]